MTEGPHDPLTGLKVAVAAIREVYITLVETGFTDDQALRFCAYYVAARGKVDEDPPVVPE